MVSQRRQPRQRQTRKIDRKYDEVRRMAPLQSSHYSSQRPGSLDPVMNAMRQASGPVLIRPH